MTAKWFGILQIFPFFLLCFYLLFGWILKGQASENITVQLKWAHQAQFAGFYVANEKGFYKDEDLSVSFLEGGRDIYPIKSMLENKAQFSVMSPEEIFISRARAIPIKAIAAIYRQSAVVFLSMPGSGITRPYDFAGKTIAAAEKGSGIRDFSFQLSAMMSQLEIDLSTIRLVPYDPEYTQFLAGKVDITPSYITGGLITIRQKGINPNIIWPGDYRVRFYSDTLVTTETMIKEKPELVTRFLRATLKGWQKAIENQDQALDDVLKYARIKDKKLQKAMLEALVPLVHTGKDTIGWMTADEWNQMHTILLKQKLLSVPLAHVDQTYTLEFLKRIKDRGKQ